MRSTLLAALLVAVFSPMAGRLAADPPVTVDDDPEPSWKGIDILPRRPGLRIVRPDVRGNDAAAAELEPDYYRVRDDKNDRLLIITRRGVEGWLDVKDAIPVGDGVDYFSEMIKREPRNIWGYLCRAAAHDLEDAHDEALSDLDHAIRLAPARAASWRSRAVIQTIRKDYGAAEADFKKAFELAPADPVLHNDRGWHWMQRKLHDKARADYAEALRLDPNYPEPYANRAASWSEEKQFDRALRDYDTGLGLDPHNAYLYEERGRVRQLTKQYAQARQDFEKAVELDDQDDANLNSLAWLLATCPQADVRDGKKALEIAERLTKLTEGPDGKGHPDYLDTLAAAYAEAGRFADAVKTQERALTHADFADDARAAARTRLELYKKKRAYRDGD